MRSFEKMVSDMDTHGVNVPEQKRIFEKVLGFVPEIVHIFLDDDTTSLDDLRRVIKKAERQGVTAVQILYMKSGQKHSVALVLNPDRGTAHYRDSLGKHIPQALRNTLSEYNYEVSDTSTKQQERENECVLLTAQNLAHMLEQEVREHA